MNNQQDKIRGSLIGGAIGDALGYPVEFIYSLDGIRKRYGENGITQLDTRHGKAPISDDTHMTLYTACGLLNALEDNTTEPLEGIKTAYVEWYLAQIGRLDEAHHACWISDIKAMHEDRAPGLTCMDSLNAIYNGQEAANDSKGCGGVMRTAPVAMFAAVDGRMDVKAAMVLSVNAAKLTHLHPLGFLPSALEAYIIYGLMEKDAVTADDFKKLITDGLDLLEQHYLQYGKYTDSLKRMVNNAVMLTTNNQPDDVNIENIGGGWVGDEALVIALYCAVKYWGDFEKAVIAAVNHGGDSDSTGAVLGNILGAAVGIENIPQHFKDGVELHDVVLHVADDLWRGRVTR